MHFNRYGLGIAAIVCAIAVVAVWRIGSAAKPQRTADAPRAVASNRFERPVPVTRVEQSSLALNPIPVWDTVNESAEPDAAPEQQETSQKRSFESGHEMQLHVEGMYSSEISDRGWSGGAESSLQTAVHGKLPDSSRLLRTECRATLCRMELEHQTQGAHQEFLRALATERPWSGPMFSSAPRHENDRIYSTVFIAREGHRISGIAE
jgi:hypothetical protein